MKTKIKTKWKSLFVVCSIFIILYIGFYVWILSSVKQTVTSIYLYKANRGPVSNVSEDIRDEFLKFQTYPNRGPDDRIHIELSTGKVFHTFLYGTVWIKYTYEGIDTNTNEVKYGFSKVPIKIKVKLDNWEWKLVEKDEEP